MASKAVNLETITLPELQKDVETGLNDLIAAAAVVEKFASFLPGPVAADIQIAINVLTALESVVSKL